MASRRAAIIMFLVGRLAIGFRSAPARAARRVSTGAASVGVERDVGRRETGRPVTVVVDPSLRSSLRLVGKHRRARCFLPEGVGLDDEAFLRSAIERVIPPLALASYALEFEASDASRVDVVGTGAGDVADDDDDDDDDDSPDESFRGSSYQMLSWYHFFDAALDDDGVEAVVAALASGWRPLGVLGRAYVAPEGINAQLAVPEASLPALRKAHDALFARLGPGPAPPLNLDDVVSPGDFARRPPFRTLHVRRREQVVADGGGADGLDLKDCGDAVAPAEWHAALSAAADGGGDAKNKAPVVLDCRNHYESRVGTFEGATPLGTETFKDTYDALDGALAGKARDEPVYMFCTGGIRCVKAGSYVRQALGFTDVRRLEGGVVNYTKHLRDAGADLDDESKFRGVNYVFNDRMGETVTASDARAVASPEPLDPRAAEALYLARRGEGRRR